MKNCISRKDFLKAAAAGVAGVSAMGALGMSAFATEEAAPEFVPLKVDPTLLMTEEEGTAWNAYKSELGPLYPGYPGFEPYMNWLKQQCIDFGCIDFLEHRWVHNTYYINDWPDHDSGVLGLVSDGVEVPVGTFLRCSASSGEEGATAEMVYYDISGGAPAEGAFAGKIVYMEPADYLTLEKPFSTSFMASYVVTDTNYRSDPESPAPMHELVDPTLNCSWATRYDFGQWGTLLSYAQTGGAVAMIVGSHLTYGCLEGLYDRTSRHDEPCIVIDRVAREQVREDAKAGKTATVKLIAEFFDVDNRNFCCYLPGKDYGTEADEQIALNAHIDAMSLTQDNGSLGLLGILRYFSKIPQEQRKKTLMFCMDTRHFIEGAERGSLEHDPYNVYPQLREMAVACIGLEHMGEMEGALDYENNDMVPTNRPEYTFMKSDDNDWCAKILIQAAVDSGLERADIKIDGRPGMHGVFKGYVRAVMASTHSVGCCEIGQAGNWPGAHTQTFSTMQYFGPKKFRDEVHLWTQVVQNLMHTDAIVYDIAWDELNQTIRGLGPAEVAQALSGSVANDTAGAEIISSTAMQGMLGAVASIFTHVEIGEYEIAAIRMEKELPAIIQTIVPEENREDILTKVDALLAKLQAAIA